MKSEIATHRESVPLVRRSRENIMYDNIMAKHPIRDAQDASVMLISSACD